MNWKFTLCPWALRRARPKGARGAGRFGQGPKRNPSSNAVVFLAADLSQGEAEL
ncbi:hypothetical protein RSK20926_20970 [Roseobacter sp. SK209-2-6]|nr:hypothetical protein RSK20926_20970 [Roseobacter sp. SK209-2-6]